MPRSDLPFGSEFSPQVIDLRKLLELAAEHGDDWRAFEDAVRREYFVRETTSDYNLGKLANNTKLAMRAYGLMREVDASLTDLGLRLYQMRDNPTRLHEVLAQHILLNLHGVTLVQCVQDMQAAGVKVTLTTLREWLEERGIHFPRGGKHPSIMRLWLEKAGVFVRGWQVDQRRLDDLLGLTEPEIEALAGMSLEQRAYLKTLANLTEAGPFASNQVEKLAAATYGVRFNEKSLPKQVLYPLRDAGYVTLERGTKEEGRGAKPFLISPTYRLNADVLGPLLEQLEAQVHADLRPFLRRPLSDIVADLEVADRHVRGLALEALAIRLMRLVDLSYVATRLRGVATGGAEVDVIFESARLMYSRWQIQCKNTASVRLDDVAKEVGLVQFLKSNVIVVVTTGAFAGDARLYARKVMKDTNLHIALLDAPDVSAIAANPAVIVDILNREAGHAMRLKELTLE
jgi:hypothetical protein